MIAKTIMKMLEKAVTKKGASKGAETVKKVKENDEFMKGLKETEQKINKAEHLEAKSAANKAESITATYAFGDGKVKMATKLPQQVAEDRANVVKDTIRTADLQAATKAKMTKIKNDSVVNTPERDAKASFIKAAAYKQTKNAPFAKSYGETLKDNAKKTVDEGKEFEKKFLEALMKIKK